MEAQPPPAAPADWPSLEIGWLTVIVPNAAMMINHARGGSAVIINAVVNSPLGVRGLFLLPLLGVTMEKSFYDTTMCLRAIDPKARGKRAGDPEMPSFSLVPLREKPLQLTDLVPNSLAWWQHSRDRTT